MRCSASRRALRGCNLAATAARTFELRAGDVVVLPAGTGHQRLIASADFVVIGGYPPHGSYNLCRGDNRPSASGRWRRSRRCRCRQSDPVQGKNGALVNLWRR